MQSDSKLPQSFPVRLNSACRGHNPLLGIRRLERRSHNNSAQKSLQTRGKTYSVSQQDDNLNLRRIGKNRLKIEAR